MINKIKNSLLALATVMTLSFGTLATAPVAAAIDCSKTPTDAACQQKTINGNLCNGSNFDLSGNGAPKDTANCNDQGSNSVSGKIKTILNIFSALVGIVAVIMIIYAGFRYVTSAGSEGGVKAAKNAIVYAVIGLVVVALAQIIVHFVISNVTS